MSARCVDRGPRCPAQCRETTRLHPNATVCNHCLDAAIYDKGRIMPR